MPFELYVALRYLFARRKQAFISVISLVSMLGVTVGVMALVIALALMTGLQQGVRDRMLGSSAHVYVFKAGGLPDYHAEVARLRQVPDVLGAAPALMGKALVSHGDQQAFITIKGIDPALEPDRHRDRLGDHRRRASRIWPAAAKTTCPASSSATSWPASSAPSSATPSRC